MAERPRCALSVEQLESRDVPSAIGDVIPGHYIVTLRPGVDAGAFAAELQTHGRAVSHVYTHGLSGLSFTGAPLGFDPRVASVEPDRVVQIEGGPGKPTSPPPPPAQVVPTGVARVGGTDGKSYGQVNVAIIDTGIDASHPDLNVKGGYNFTTVKTQNWADDNGHGTHVSGTVAALDNSIGVVGVAPGAALWGIKVLNKFGNGWVSDIIAGVDWVTATRTDADTTNDIAVANMSLGFTGTSDALHNAIKASVAKGVVYVVAAMNNAADATTFSPAGYSEVITVSALADSDGKPGGLGGATSYGNDDTLATFSDYGSVVDIAAPGVDIYSTLPGGKYGTGSGTSMAAPHVTGAVVRYIAANGATKLTNADATVAARDALVAASQPMSDWGDNAVASDPDIYHEGTLYLSRDVAITALFLTPDNRVGVTVANLSATAQTAFTVELYDGTRLLATLTIEGLAGGGSQTLTFDYTATPGQTLTAKVRTAFDLDLTNNSLDLSV